MQAFLEGVWEGVSIKYLEFVMVYGAWRYVEVCQGSPIILTLNQRVVGSNPTVPTIKINGLE
jgi:hypothetical protein